ncbi:hypothetical protein B0H21DRAFT_846282 [Amylocystis lapponica]|nr:hypothetical protein B0H21DRAFT_846282 [Amylocystis lapponica]
MKRSQDSDSDSEVKDSDQSGLSHEASSQAAVMQQNAQKTVLLATLKHRAKTAKRTDQLEPAHRTNWQNHWTWIEILNAQSKVGWGVTNICKHPWIKKPEWYQSVKGKPGDLHKGTVAKWIEDDGEGGKKWTAEVLAHAECGRIGEPYPEIVAAINTQLKVIHLIDGCVQHPLAGIGLFPTGKYTYKKKGAKDVSIAGHKEKQQTTVLVVGVPASQIKLPTELSILCNASIAWFLNAYDFFAQNSKIVKKAWANCKFKTPAHGVLDLSYSSINSSSAFDHCQELMVSNETLQQEIAKFNFSAITGASEDDSAVDNLSAADFDDETTLTSAELFKKLNGEDVHEHLKTEVIVPDRQVDTDFKPTMLADFHP